MVSFIRYHENQPDCIIKTEPRSETLLNIKTQNFIETGRLIKPLFCIESYLRIKTHYHI